MNLFFPNDIFCLQFEISKKNFDCAVVNKEQIFITRDASCMFLYFVLVCGISRRKTAAILKSIVKKMFLYHVNGYTATLTIYYQKPW